MRGSNPTDTTLIEVKSIRNINYEELGLENKEDIDKLIRIENDVKFHEEKTKEHLFKFSKAIFEANEVFSNNKSGSFGKWTELIGISRDTANTAVRRYQFYLEMQGTLKEPKRILQLPVRIIKEFTGTKKEIFEDAEVVEVIESENPTEMLKKIKELKDIVKLADKTNLREFLNKEKVRKQNMINKLREEIKEIDEELRKLDLGIISSDASDDII
ncbi:MAG: hypothetical protein KBF12_08605 [Sebaldella sp.]|nr:hypothetical protein [Sebaldella sp.]